MFTDSMNKDIHNEMYKLIMSFVNHFRHPEILMQIYPSLLFVMMIFPFVECYGSLYNTSNTHLNMTKGCFGKYYL